LSHPNHEGAESTSDKLAFSQTSDVITLISGFRDETLARGRSTQEQAGVEAIKLLFSSLTEKQNKLVLVLVKPFQPGVIFASKTGAYRSGASFRWSPLE